MLAVLLAVAVVRTAWMSDDAFVTLRTLDNALHGLGLRYNPAERVQAFTHPLWLGWIALPYALTREPWLTTIAVGALTSAAALALAVRRVAAGPGGAAVLLALLVASKAWVDYATAGLENPLVWLLVAGFAAVLFQERPRLGALVLLAALVGLTRLDALVVVLPALALETVRAWRAGQRRAVLQAQVGWAPLAAWHVAALVYYGSTVPNTAWAKLGAGVPALTLVVQSLHYFAWTARHDPVTLPAVAVGLGLGLARRDARVAALALGGALYLAYVARIGGDFMAGRFLTLPLWVAALIVARTPLPPRLAGGIAAVALVASLASPYAPLRAGPHYRRAPPEQGVVDERGFYWTGTGVLVGRWRWRPNHLFAAQARVARAMAPLVEEKAVVGLYGFYAGPRVHVVDVMGLTDPLLARLPVPGAERWRIGHFRRAVPEGYLQTLASGHDALEDPEVRALYADVQLATRGPLWTRARWAAIGRLEARALRR
ncbi:MAG: hypothetical protein R3F59_22025 [Myxococcota bacterium]